MTDHPADLPLPSPTDPAPRPRRAGRLLVRLAMGVREQTRLAVALAVGLVLLGGCGVPLAAGPSPTQTGRLDAFVVAHPDDWQLFMGDVAWAAARSGSPTVFITTTAGDAGQAAAYWEAREAGSLASVAVAQGHAPPDSAGAAGLRATCAPGTVAGHTVRRCVLGTSVAYYLRLPDGNLQGDGFAATGGWSLMQFAAGGPAPSATLDGQVPFTSWQALADGVAAILTAEAAAAQASGAQVRIHASDHDVQFNPGDHEDHRATGRLAGEVARAHGWAHVRYAGYVTRDRPTNLGVERFAAKAALFMAYDRARLLADPAWSAYAEAPPYYSAWLSRTYARVGDTP